MDERLEKAGPKNSSDAFSLATMAALRESEERYRLLVEMIPGIVYRASAAEEGKLLYISPRIETLLGLSASEWLEIPAFWRSRIHEYDRARVMDDWAQACRHKRAFASEYRVAASSGRIIWFRDEALPVLDADGRILFMQGLMLDISERRQAEIEMHEWHDEIERLMGLQVAAQTAAALAHDLNQPLNAVTSFNAAALRLLQAGNPQSEKLHHALEQSAAQAERAGRVVRDLLALLHKGEVVTESVWLNAEVREAVRILESDGYIDGVKAELELDPHVPTVKANRLQVQKVLVNLMRNAVEAIRGAGMSGGLVRIRTEVLKNMARVSVEDNGPGLDKDNLKHIFEPFFTTKSEGIGMGLAISQSLIRSHGGKLWAERGQDGGALFHFTLPLTD